MYYLLIEQDTNIIIGSYSKSTHSNIPKEAIQISEKTWTERLNNVTLDTYVNGVLSKQDRRTLEDFKSLKKDEINATCEKAIISGFKSSSLQDEYLYQSDRDDQLNLTGLVANGIDDFLKCGLVTIVLENSIEKKVITWDYKLHTIAQLKDVLADGAKYKLDLLIKANTLKIQVQNATTVNELDGINW